MVLVPPLDRLEPSSRSVPALSPAALVGVARELATERERWLDLVEHRPDERWFTRVAADGDFDVWLIGWDSFQGVELHDHGGAAGVLYVVDGTLQETAASRHGPRRLTEQTLPAGTARAFGTDHVHRVVNPSARPATSLHLYSPPLEAMGFYRPSVEGGLEHLHTEAALAPRSGPGELR
jgi:hypothetical protein